MRLGRGIAPLLAALGRRLDALEIADVLPPAGVPLVGGQVVGVDVGLPVRHDAGRPEDERHAGGQRVIQQEGLLIDLEAGGQDAERLQVGRHAGRERGQLAEALMEGRVGAGAQQHGHVIARVADEVINMTELVVGGREPPGGGFDALQ